LPEGCKVEEVEDTYLLFIYGKEMVTADSGKFYILDVGKKCLIFCITRAKVAMLNY